MRSSPRHLRAERVAPFGAVSRRAVEQSAGEDLFLSVISTREIAKGIALVRESQKKRALTGWLQTLERDCADRLLAIDLETSRLWGELTAATQKTVRIITGGRRSDRRHRAAARPAPHDPQYRIFRVRWRRGRQSMGGLEKEMV